MLPCGALERSNSPFIESIVFLKIRKRSSQCGFKRVRQWKKKSMSSRKGNLCTSVLEKKKKTLKLL